MMHWIYNESEVTMCSKKHSNYLMHWQKWRPGWKNIIDTGKHHKLLYACRRTWGLKQMDFLVDEMGFVLVLSRKQPMITFIGCLNVSAPQRRECRKLYAASSASPHGSRFERWTKWNISPSLSLVIIQKIIWNAVLIHFYLPGVMWKSSSSMMAQKTKPVKLPSPDFE